MRLHCTPCSLFCMGGVAGGGVTPMSVREYWVLCWAVGILLVCVFFTYVFCNQNKRDIPINTIKVTFSTEDISTIKSTIYEGKLCPPTIFICTIKIYCITIYNDTMYILWPESTIQFERQHVESRQLWSEFEILVLI